MDEDSVTLAAAWRERAAAGNTNGVTVELRSAGWAVTEAFPDDGTTTIAVFGARYKADAYAEKIARQFDTEPGEA